MPILDNEYVTSHIYATDGMEVRKLPHDGACLFTMDFYEKGVTY